MKRAFLITVLAVALSASSVQAQMGRGMMMDKDQPQQADSSQQGYPCQMGPGMMMGYGMGPGMMRGMGHGMGCGYGCCMGQGMMGYGMGPGMMGGGMGMMGGGMMGQGMMGNYDDEKQQKFLDETVGLRKKIHDKKFEYFEAARDPKATRESLMKKEKEIYDLNQQLQEKSKEALR